jgi:hypothetical protein
LKPFSFKVKKPGILNAVVTAKGTFSGKEVQGEFEIEGEWVKFTVIKKPLWMPKLVILRIIRWVSGGRD